MSRVSVVGLSPHFGELSRGMVGVPGLTPPWEVPVVVARGRQVGPTLVVTSGVHAAEYVPIEAVTQFSRQLDLELLRGTFIAVLIVNMPGFYERTIYVNPRDGKNINRVFPGSPTGSDSERVADFLVREVIDGADAYIDAHCGDLIEALLPFTISIESGSPKVDQRSASLATAFGLPYSMSITRDSIRGTSSGTAAERGIPAIAAEVGQQGIVIRRRSRPTGMDSIESPRNWGCSPRSRVQGKSQYGYGNLLGCGLGRPGPSFPQCKSART